MSAHSHQDNHVSEKGPVAFTAPFILACVTLLFVFFFLSLCNPKPHSHEAGHAEGAVHDQPAHQDMVMEKQIPESAHGMQAGEQEESAH